MSGPGAKPPYEEEFEGWYSTTSYVANGTVLSLQPNGEPVGIKSLRDGAAQTIMLAERLQVCGEVPTLWGMAAFSATTASFSLRSPVEQHPKSTNAGYELKQWVPPAKVAPDTQVPVAFQLMPKPGTCDPTILQTMNPTGMIVCLFDGSSRIINFKVNPRAFWAAVTPAGDEELGTDW